MDMVTLYQSAQDLDAFVERIRNEAALYGLDMDCSWHYLDDQAAPDAQQQEGVQTQIAIVPGEYTVIYTDQNGDPVPGDDPVLRRGHLHRGGIRRNRGCHLRGRISPMRSMLKAPDGYASRTKIT